MSGNSSRTTRSRVIKSQRAGALVHAMQSITGRILRYHVHVGLQIPIHEVAESLVLRNKRAKRGSAHLPHVSGHLANVPVRRRGAAHNERNSRHAFTPDGADLDNRSILHDRHDRKDGIERKVDVVDWPLRFVNRFSERQTYDLAALRMAVLAYRICLRSRLLLLRRLPALRMSKRSRIPQNPGLAVKPDRSGV